MGKAFKTIVSFIRNSLLLRKAIILIWHVTGIGLSYFLAFLLRFDGAIPPAYYQTFVKTLPYLILISIFVFPCFKLYSGIWAYFSLYDVFRIVAAIITTLILFMPIVFFTMGRTFIDYPRSVPVIVFLLLGLWMTSGRLAIRWLREYRAGTGSAASGKRALVVGNLTDVDHLIRSASLQPSDIGQFVGIVSNDANGHNLTMRGVRVMGSVSNIGDVAKKTRADCILILPPYTRPKEMNSIVAKCEEAGVACAFRMIPSMTDLASGRIELSNIRTVEIEDLLGRPEITFDKENVSAMIEGRNVMVTGAGGSIGSELVRQISQYRPASVVLLDVSEYNLYTIDMELRKKMPDLQIKAIAGSVGEEGLVRKALRECHIQILFHAAAYKHVPLMEDNVAACIANNTIGTARLAAEAEDAGVDRFVLISTDKAVRPTSVMGASKRLAERILQERPKSDTSFVMVRFGNVLGSSGSVIPLFKKQIEEGGPVTVTSENMTRFFMSIPEAVDLVLQASEMGKDREIMVLEMGESVRVADMAKHLIELSGLRVGEDIEIVFTGLRPGEKEYEELITDDENVVRTPFEKVWVMQSRGDSTSPPIDLDRLGRLVQSQNEHRIRNELLRLIPEACADMAKDRTNSSAG